MKAADQFRMGDVTAWGITALAIWGVAVLSANLPGAMPPGVYSALHASRADGSTLSQLRTQLAALEQEAARSKRDTTQLAGRFELNAQSTADITKRLGALEASLPKLVEAQFAAAQPLVPPDVDETTTASIDGAEQFEVEGGSVAVRQQPYIPMGKASIKPAEVASTMPAPLAFAVGVGLGLPVAPQEAAAKWQALVKTSGAALTDLKPVLATAQGTADKLLIAGPLADRQAAVALCGQLSPVGIACQPLPYVGEPLLGSH